MDGFTRQAVACFQRGDIARAEALCRQAIHAVPLHVPALLLLGQILTERGEGAAAMSTLGPAVARRPDLAPAHFNMGRAAHVAGHLDIAVAALRRALALDPGLAVAHRNLAAVLLDGGKAEAALAHARQAVEMEPEQAENHFVAAKVLEALDRGEPAEGALLRAIELDPTRAEAHNALGRLRQLAGKPDQAVANHQRAVELQPDYAVAYAFLATALQNTHDYDGAEAAFRKALDLKRDQHQAWNGLGTLYRSLGRFEAAAAAFREAIAINPDFGAAHRNLATCEQAVADAAEEARLGTILENTALTRDARAQAGLALGKRFDDAGRYDEAFERFSRAKALTREAEIADGERFDAAALNAEIDRIAEVFTPDFFHARRDWGVETELPVFICGLFRSGTTLTEQIAASHSGVFGAGELSEIRQLSAAILPAPEAALEWRPESIRKAAEMHLGRLERLGKGAIRVVDKNPENVFSLGLIATIYPSARIVLCHRDGRDTALSCFFQGFSHQQSFASDLADCGRRWLATERMAAYWREALPLRVMDMQYEALVADLEGESRRLIEFLGLGWEEACLNFHETERSVRTASMWQVRQPLYSTSVARWKNYERHLGPLLAALAEPEAPSATD